MARAPQDPAWKTNEKIVAALERHLTPGARISHDQRLPVLDAPDETRQIDVLIEQGAEPRITRSIVEVQKRARRPSRDQFIAWMRKMEEVGAQHLICVSEAGFSRPVLRMAQERGPTVRLLTLKELEESDWPLPPALNSNVVKVFSYHHMPGLQFEGQHLMRQDPNRDHSLPPNPHEKIFKIPNGKEVSPSDLVDWQLFSRLGNDQIPLNRVTKYRFQFGPWERGDSDAISAKEFGGRWVPLLWLKIDMHLSAKQIPIEWTTSRYQQVHHGDIAWILRGQAKDAGAEIDVFATLIEEAPGAYRVGYIHTLNDVDAFMSFGDQGYKAHPVENLDEPTV